MMATDKFLSSELQKLQLDLETWLETHKPRRYYVPKLKSLGIKIEKPKKVYNRKIKHKNKQELHDD